MTNYLKGQKNLNEINYTLADPAININSEKLPSAQIFLNNMDKFEIRLQVY